MGNPSITEKEAVGLVKEKYEEMKNAFRTPVVPILFTFIAPYEEYFLYIADQIIRNVTDPRFQKLVNETGDSVQSIVTGTMLPSIKYSEWIKRYSYSPQFYHFRANNEYIFRMNVTLAFIFIALRETVKGWAVAAKKLTSSQGNTPINTPSSSFQEGTPLYEEVLTGADIVLKTTTLAVKPTREVEANLLPEFLSICHEDFRNYSKTEEFLLMRVGLEKVILMSLPLFPDLIFSPINVILKLVMKYPTFPDLLYLLSEEFPTLVMQRMIFSGYMMNR